MPHLFESQKLDLEYHIAIPKTDSPEDELWNIASTAIFSKQYEIFIEVRLFPFIELYRDTGQCGGLKGIKISHY